MYYTSYYAGKLLQAEKQHLLRITVIVTAGDGKLNQSWLKQIKTDRVTRGKVAFKKCREKKKKGRYNKNLGRNTTKRKIHAAYVIILSMLAGV